MRDLKGIVQAHIESSAKRNALAIADKLQDLVKELGDDLHHVSAVHLLNSLYHIAKQLPEGNELRTSAEYLHARVVGNQFVSKVPEGATGPSTYTPYEAPAAA